MVAASTGSMSSITGSLSQVWALVQPSPAATVADAHHGLGRQVVADPAVHAVGDERLDHGHQAVPGEGADGLRAGRDGRSGRRVVGVDAHQHLAALEAHPADRLGVVAGEAVVDLEHRAGQAATVHRADHDLALERAEEQEVLDDVGGAEDAVHARSRQRDRQALAAAGAGRPSRARRRRPAGSRARCGRPPPASAVRCCRPASPAVTRAAAISATRPGSVGPHA